MFVLCKKYYYFDEKDKKMFINFLTKQDITNKEFAKMCGISVGFLSLLFNGKRAISKEIADIFTKNGYKVEIYE